MQSSEIYQYLPTQSVKALKRIRDFIDKLVDLKMPHERKSVPAINPSDYVTYKESFILDSVCDSLMSELNQNCPHLDTPSDKSRSVWFTNSETPYSWSTARTGSVTRKKPLPIDQNSVMMQVLYQINNSLGTSLNACLVQ